MTIDNEIFFTAAQSVDTGNVTPLLHEIRHALARLIAHQTETVIDLRRIPLTPNEEAHLSTFLGSGEVQATVNAMGPTEIQETSYSGVWIVTHYNTEGEMLGKNITIAIVPGLVNAQIEEIQSSNDQFIADLESLSNG